MWVGVKGLVRVQRVSLHIGADDLGVCGVSGWRYPARIILDRDVNEADLNSLQAQLPQVAELTPPGGH